MTAIPLRKPTFRFDDVPRDWLGGAVLPTHLANALHLLFPLGERFFIRSVRHYLDRIDDPALLEAVKGFTGQEIRHGLAHEAAFERLEAQGYEIRSFLAWYEKVAYGGIERVVPKPLSLAVTVALEHFTAMFAQHALTDGMLDTRAHPAMRDLLLWHACEEIEHKAVAFDVLRKVHPSGALRVAGLFMALSVLLFFWMAGVRHLMRQEPPERRKGALRQLLATRQNNALLNGAILGAFLRALRPGFHPNDVDDGKLAADWLERNAEALGLA